MAATLPPPISWSHIMQGEVGLLVCVLLRSRMCTIVSVSKSSDELGVTFSGEPLAQSINNWLPDVSSLLLVTEWPVSKAGWRSCTWCGIPLTRTDCWLTTQWQDLAQHMALKPPSFQVTVQCQFPLPKSGRCRWVTRDTLTFSVTLYQYVASAMVQCFLVAILLMLQWLLSAILLPDGTYTHCSHSQNPIILAETALFSGCRRQSCCQAKFPLMRNIRKRWTIGVEECLPSLAIPVVAKSQNEWVHRWWG